jgi:phage recombination protein Bet
MSNTAVAKQTVSLPAMAMSEDELMSVLRSSLYVGAKDESIKMAVNYCKAAGLDIMQKPVHLVPMYDSASKGMRDVVMPGIGLYRTQASRSGEMAGISEPEFGEDVTFTFEAEKGYENKVKNALTITYPKWCRVTVKKLMPNGGIAEYHAKELWVENYATAGKDSAQPNAMWKKRPYAQLAKCAEAQALRKAFPELGSMPTAEEMEGKDIEIDVTPTNAPAKAPEPVYYTDDEFHANTNGWLKVIENGKTPERFMSFIESKGKKFTDEQKEVVMTWGKKPQVVDGESTVVNDSFVNDMETAEKAEQK